MTKPARARTVAVVAGYEWIFVSPSTVSAVEMLVERGFQVQLMARRQSQHFPGLGVGGGGVGANIYPWADQGWNLNVRHAVFALWTTWQCFRRRPDLVIAMDSEALIASSVYAALSRIPVFYYSLEIATWQPYPSLNGSLLHFPKRWLGAAFRNFWKFAEATAHRRAALTIIQEPTRAEVLRRENGLVTMETAYVPPSLRTSYRPAAKPRYLREKLDIRDDRVIILNAGGIAHYYLLHELAQAAAHWPDNWVLVIHGWFHEDDPYHVQLDRLCDGQKIILSRHALPQAEFDALVASADVGVALYRDVGPNHYHITSGKLMQYLRCGLPVVATDFPNLKDIVERHRCGLCVPDPGSVASAISRILPDQARLSEVARATFDEHYRFDRHFARVTDRIDASLRDR